MINKEKTIKEIVELRDQIKAIDINLKVMMQYLSNEVNQFNYWINMEHAIERINEKIKLVSPLKTNHIKENLI